MRLHAWYAPAAASAWPGAWYTSPGGAPVLVWSHGNGGNIANRADAILALQTRGVSVLAYDYRGYGRSQGQPSEAGLGQRLFAAAPAPKRIRRLAISARGSTGHFP